jgi:hypothetical protein
MSIENDTVIARRRELNDSSTIIVKFNFLTSSRVTLVNDGSGARFAPVRYWHRIP